MSNLAGSIREKQKTPANVPHDAELPASDRPLSGRGSTELDLLLDVLLFKKQIVQGTERTVLFNLINGHFVAAYAPFNETAPAIKLVGTDFSDVFGLAVRTTIHF